jgi:hypothetical protein
MSDVFSDRSAIERRRREDRARALCALGAGTVGEIDEHPEGRIPGATETNVDCSAWWSSLATIEQSSGVKLKSS